MMQPFEITRDNAPMLLPYMSWFVQFKNTVLAVNKLGQVVIIRIKP